MSHWEWVPRHSRWLHRCRALGVYHRFRLKHLQYYLDEFAFLFNRRKTRNAAFRSLLGIARHPVHYLQHADQTGSNEINLSIGSMSV